MTEVTDLSLFRNSHAHEQQQQQQQEEGKSERLSTEAGFLNIEDKFNLGFSLIKDGTYYVERF